MKIEQFFVTIKDGRFHFNSDSHRNLFMKFLQQFEDKEVVVDVKEKKSHRSDAQNGLYFAYLTDIANTTGYTKNELHELFKGKFLSDGISELFGEKVRRKKSTKVLTKGEFTEYLVDIENFTGIPVPDVSEYYQINI